MSDVILSGGASPASNVILSSSLGYPLYYYPDVVESFDHPGGVPLAFTSYTGSRIRGRNGYGWTSGDLTGTFTPDTFGGQYYGIAAYYPRDTFDSFQWYLQWDLLVEYDPVGNPGVYQNWGFLRFRYIGDGRIIVEFQGPDGNDGNIRMLDGIFLTRGSWYFFDFGQGFGVTQQVVVPGVSFRRVTNAGFGVTVNGVAYASHQSSESFGTDVIVAGVPLWTGTVIATKLTVHIGGNGTIVDDFYHNTPPGLLPGFPLGDGQADPNDNPLWIVSYAPQLLTQAFYEVGIASLVAKPLDTQSFYEVALASLSKPLDTQSFYEVSLARYLGYIASKGLWMQSE